jgi:L-lactate dehydrogenase complex protein LldG
MNEPARERILGRLRATRVVPPAPPSDFSVLERKRWPAEERYPRLRRMMEAVHTEFLETTPAAWPAAVRDFLLAEGLPNLLYGPATPAGHVLAEAWPEGKPELLAYDRPIEEFKRELFEEVAAGFTTTRGGIAETGGLILWPSPEEPRLMSLVPPVHLALLDTAQIYDTFHHAMAAQRWAEGLPANALLVSGPSKTADIEQTLAYGVHGPKRLIVVAVLTESGLAAPGLGAGD